MKKHSYVLVTPVRNEESTIGVTIESVIKQTALPEEWVIVSDGSTDRTDEIVKRYAGGAPFIHLLRLEHRPERNFASVVFALEAGIEALTVRDYGFIGLLDGDIKLPQNYYQEMVFRLESDPSLGLVGGLVIDCCNGRRRRNIQSLRDVAGAVQFFRRECFEAQGRLIALAEGGWDVITCVQARRTGFLTRTFREIEVEHLKPRNIAEGDILKRFRQLGEREYALGYHPAFELVKGAYRCLEYPWVVGGLMRLVGYVSCYLGRKQRVLPAALMEFIRQEQLERLFGGKREVSKSALGSKALRGKVVRG